MRKLIATYRFQIAFIISLALHLSAFMLCPHFGGEQGDTTSYQTVEVNFTDASHPTVATCEENDSNDAPAHFEEAVFKEPADKASTEAIDNSPQDTPQTSPSQRKTSEKNSPTPHQGKQKAGNATISGESDGLDIFSLEQATLLKRLPLPSYPAYARKRGLEGSVTVQVLINANGLIKNIKMIDVQGSDVFEKALRSTIRRSWQGVFAPPKKAGHYVDGWIEITIPFRLK